MNDFIVYAEKKAFNEITFNGSYPNLRSVFTNHSTIFLNLTTEEIEENIISEGEIFYYLHAYAAAKIPQAHPDQFLNVYEDGRNLLANPRSIYFLNITQEEAANLQEQYGMIVQSSDFITDDLLKGGAHKELLKEEVLNNGESVGWKCLLDFPLPPSNSIVITDDWLFNNEEVNNIVGEGNLVSFLDAILPKNLKTDYHILIITDDQGRSQKRCEKLAGNLKSKITGLRNYPIVFELVFAETIHKRKAILNYLSVTCDKGFAMFRLSDLQTIRDDNDFRHEKVFNRTEKHEGDTVYYSDTILLKKIKVKCNTVKEYITNRHQDPNHRILGDCNKDKSIKNRLINDV
jgi:hypothetical protein